MDEETKNETPTEEQSEETEKDETTAEESAETVNETPEQSVPTLEQIQAENTQLRAEILRGRLEAEVMAQAPTLDVAPNAMPYLLKLADLSGAVTDKGEVDKDAVTEAVKKVLDDLPALKKAPEQNSGFMNIGGDGKKHGTDTDEDRMRRWFGLKPKN